MIGDVGKRIRAGGDRQTKSAVQKAVPDFHGGNFIEIAHHVHSVHFPQRQVNRQQNHLSNSIYRDKHNGQTQK